MPPTDRSEAIDETPGHHHLNWRGGVILVAGLILCQAILFFPSFSGRKLLTATDILIAQGVLGRDVSPAEQVSQNLLFMDLPQIGYPFMDFAARKIRAGHLPLWNPYIYCGSPFLPASAMFSPFVGMYYLWPDPRAHIWIHLAKSLLAGIGTYLFLRKIGSSQWAAMIGGWCFPLSGYMVAWLVFSLSWVAAWMPWGFLAAEAMVQRPRRWGGPALAAVTGLIIVSGHLETAAHLLVAIGVYGVWRWVEMLAAGLNSRKASKDALVTADPRVSHFCRHAILAAIGAVVIGLGLGAIQLLPTSAYAHSGFRMLQRARGLHEDVRSFSETAPEAIRIFFPYLLGSRQAGSHEVALSSMVYNEGGTQGYIGFTLLALLVPIAVSGHWRRNSTWFWLLLALFAAAPMFRIPVFNLWECIPPFNVARNGRALLVSAWALLVLGVKGLDLLYHPKQVNRFAAIAPTILAGICAAGFLLILIVQPASLVKAYTFEAWPWFQLHLLECALITGAGCGLMWMWLACKQLESLFAIAIGLLAVGELVISAYGYNPQVSPETYYPSRNFIRYLMDNSDNGRILGFGGVLYPNVSMAYGLRDIRGYDTVDPLPYLGLLWAANPQAPLNPPYAVSMYFSSGPSPVLDLLGVRLIITPVSVTAPPWMEVLHSDGLWIYRNPSALERAFIPRRAEYAPREAERISRLSDRSFNPRDVVLISQDFQPLKTAASGVANIVDDSGEKVLIRAKCDTESIVVLADAWAEGWSVKVDGHAAEALQADHALRAVRAPAGEHLIEWSYAPANVCKAIWISVSALAALAAWILYLAVSTRFHAD